MLIYEAEKKTKIPDSMVKCQVDDEAKRLIWYKDGMFEIESIENIEKDSIIILGIYDFNTSSFNNFQICCADICNPEENRIQMKISETAEEKKVYSALKNVEKIITVHSDIHYDFNKLNLYKKCDNLIKHNDYPYEEDYIFAGSIEEQKRYWNDCIIQNNTTEHDLEYEVAIELDGYRKYKKFLKSDFQDVVVEMTVEAPWISNIVTPDKVKRIYIGNEFCQFLFPNQDMLLKIINKCYELNMSISVATTYLHEHEISRFDSILNVLNEWCINYNVNIEVIVNDWGMCELLKKYPKLMPVLGRLLNIRRKDPRIHWGWGYDNCKDLLNENSLNCTHYQEYLNQKGIERFEFELTNGQIKIPSGRHSMHFPFYQMGTGVVCPMNALCTNYNRYKQSEIVTCPLYCEEFSLIYPKHLKLMGKGNSVFAFNDKVINDLDEYVNTNIDRIVYRHF